MTTPLEKILEHDGLVLAAFESSDGVLHTLILEAHDFDRVRMALSKWVEL